MIKESVQRSEKLKNCTHFVKITGRYAMLNITSMIREVERRAEDKIFMGDIKNTKIYDILGRKNSDSGHWADSRYWVANVDYYRNNLVDCYKDMDDQIYGRYSEDYLYRMAMKCRNDGRYVFRFRTQVLFNGIETGTWTLEEIKLGKHRQDSLGRRMKGYVRQVMRWIFPNWWF